MDQVWKASESFAEMWILKLALKGCVGAYQEDKVYFGLMGGEVTEARDGGKWEKTVSTEVRACMMARAT